MSNLPSLKALEGREVVARVLVIDENKPVVVKIVKVDFAGLWLESKKLTENFLSGMKVGALPRTFVAFVPFHQIAWILSTAEYPSFSESFGEERS